MELDERLPLRGVATGLVANLGDTTALREAGHQAVQVAFCVREPDGAAMQVAGLEAHDLVEQRAEVSWTPEEVGEREAWITVRLDSGEAVSSAGRPLFVTPHRLHFNHWSYADDQLWVTSLLTRSDEDLDREWKRGGVRVLDWAWGYSHPDAATMTASEWAAMWLDMPGRYDGFMLDEFGGGTSEIDQVMGQAVQLVEDQAPELFTALYSVGLSGEDMRSGYQVADLGLAETYAMDWRGYSTWDARYGEYVDAGIQDHSLGVLAMYLASHEAELRQQVAYVRSTFPDMPGLAFFADAQSAAATEALDGIIWDFYLAPALLLVDDGSGLVLRNLGALPASDVEVVFTDADGAEVHRATVSSLSGGEQLALEPVAGAAAAWVAEGPDHTVIAYVDPTTLWPVDAATAADALSWAEDRLTKQALVEALSGRPELSVERAAGGLTEHATLPLPAAADDGSVVLAFDLELQSAWFYGDLGVALASDDTSLGFQLVHGDSDTDLPGDSPRVVFSFSDTAGHTVRDTSPPGLSLATVYTFVASYDPDGHVRGQVFDEAEALVWDSGELAVDGPGTFDRVVFDVRDGEDSWIAWDDDASAERVELYSTALEPYTMRAWVSAVRVGADWVP